MLKMRLIAASMLFVAASAAHARDVAVQQAAYNNALQKFEKAEEEYKSDQQSVADMESIIERKRKQLAEEQKKLDVSKGKYLEAKGRLEQAQSALDQAWKD